MLLGPLLTVIISLSLMQADDQADPVVEYYWNKTHDAYVSYNLMESGKPYRLVARTYYKHVDKHGKVIKTDSASVEYFYSGDQVDSQRVLNGDNSRFSNLDLTFANVFELDLYHYTYPNDTGGTHLALGFDSKTGSVDPDGLLVIDRRLYLLRWLYLYYPSTSGVKRLTRSFRFTEVEGYVFPDSIWEVGARSGIFSLEYYRLETGIVEIEVIH